MQEGKAAKDVGVDHQRNIQLEQLRQRMFDKHGSFLQERLDPDSGLLDKLIANKTLRSNTMTSRTITHTTKEMFDFYTTLARRKHTTTYSVR